MNVFKFGGSCLTGPGSLERVRRHIESAGLPCVCVFSALKGITDRLLGLADAAVQGAADPTPLIAEHFRYLEPLPAARREAAEAKLRPLSEELKRALKGIELLGEASSRTLDRIVSYGERAAIVLAEAMLADAGLPVLATEGGDPSFVTDEVFGDARIEASCAEAVRERYGRGDVVHLVPGFLAKTRAGDLVTLGRGGSDYTATFIGSVLGATTTLFKDTAGLLTANPAIAPDARLLERLHYLDALELSHYGTEAIAEKAILPAMEAGTAIEIRSFADPSVRSFVSGEEASVLAITCVRRAAMVDFLGLRGNMLRTLSRLFDALADTRTYPLLVTEASPRGETSLVLKEKDLPWLQRYAVERADERPTLSEVGVVSVIGGRMRGRVGTAAGIFECLARASVNILAISQTASERNVSVVVGRDKVEAAVRALHARFIEQE